MVSSPGIRHRARLARERRFRVYGRSALTLAVAMLFILLGSLIWRGLPAFIETQIRLNVRFDMAALEVTDASRLSGLSPLRYAQLAQQALQARFAPREEDPMQLRALGTLISAGGAGKTLKREALAHPEWWGGVQLVWLPASAHVQRALRAGLDNAGDLSPEQLGWLRALEEEGAIRNRFNTAFFTGGDSRTPETAGFLGAMAGSLLMLAVCMAAAFPVGVMTAVYLQEFAKPGKLVDLIEVNINNLAAVPSIVFGLLGLAVYLNWFGMPRSSPLVGGLTLALMILPVIIIATRTALGAVPDSIRQAALALGASKVQVVWHHTLRLALPGIMTGTILGIARALGETAPLLMIGMVAFIADIPSRFTDPATVMPVQIYLWTASPEAGFAEKTSAGILVLLAVLLSLNALAIYIRRRFEVRW